MELLIPTLNKSVSNQFLLILLEGTNHEQSSHGGTKSFENIYEEVILDRGTNDQIMSRWGSSFI